jgi:hypothetical protein
LTARPRRSACAAAIIAGLALLAARVFAGEPVREYTDETTAATITVADESLVFARERTDLAVNARDYVSLAPLEINRGGERSYFWFAFVWSTIDRRDGEPLLLDQDELVLIADGRPIKLVRDLLPLSRHGVAAEPLQAPVKNATRLLLPADPEIFNFVAGADRVEVRRVRDGISEPFELWRDSRKVLRAWLRHLELDQP